VTTTVERMWLDADGNLCREVIPESEIYVTDATKLPPLPERCNDLGSCLPYIQKWGAACYAAGRAQGLEGRVNHA
jgi:hypothetical protein